MTRIPAALVLLLTLAAPLAADPYIRFGAGVTASEDAHVRDRDCESTQPPALFGCGAGVDGQPLGARGDFGDSAMVEIAAGIEIAQRARIELAIAERPNLELDARANFIGVAGEQPVHADLNSRSAMVVGAIDLAPRAWRLRPFVQAGAGIAQNQIEAVTYEFPALGASAVTRTAGGSDAAFAWQAGVGAAFRLAPSVDLELSVVRSDLGEVSTDDGIARIVRPNRLLAIDIAGTTADLETTAILLSVRLGL